MLDKLQLQRIMYEAEQSMERDGNLDINLAASGLRQAAEKFLTLLEHPEMRPVQEKVDLLMADRIV